MAKSLAIWQYAAGTTVLDNNTRYFALSSSTSGSLTEVDNEVPVRLAGVFSNLYIYAPTNTATVNTAITLRKSQTDTAVTVTYGPDETGVKEDVTNTATFANTDEGCIAVAVPSESGSNSITLVTLGAEFTPTDTSKCLTLFVNTAITNITAASSTTFFSPFGRLNFTATESLTKFQVRGTFTAPNFSMTASSNARTTDTVFTTRINGADGNQTVTFAASETGRKEDSTNTDSIVAGDDINGQCVTGAGTETLTMTQSATPLVNTSNQFQLAVSEVVAQAQAFNATEYYTINGRIEPDITDESKVIYLPRFDFTAKQLSVRATSNTIATSPTVVTLRDNLGDSAVTISFDAGETGIKTDTTNTTAITGGTDEIDYQIVTPNTSGNFGVVWLSIIGETAGVVPPSGDPWIGNQFFQLMGVGT